MLRLHESVQVPCVFLKLLSRSCLRWCWWCCCWWWWRRVFIFSTGSPSVPYIVSRTDRRQVSGEICWMFGSATVGIPSDKSGTSAGELLANPMVRLKGWKGESWYTSLFHHAGYCLKLKNSYLPFAIKVLISIDAQHTFLMIHYVSVSVMRKCAIISSKYGN